MCRPLVERETARSGDLAKGFIFCRVRAATRHRGSGSFSAPPCETELSAALSPRFTDLHPSGFHPWRKDSRADTRSVFRNACAVAVAESESADRVCRDGLKVGGEASGGPSQRTAMSSPCRQRPREPLHRDH
jgi:hypothetical protein